MNFAAVFAELLPHSELAAAERCGVNLAQDLLDRSWKYLPHGSFQNLKVNFFCPGYVVHTSSFRGAEPILKAAKLASVAPLLQPPTIHPALDQNVQAVETK